MKTAKSFREMSTRHLECRHLNHAWKHQMTFMREQRTIAEVHLQCTRCKATRIDNYIRSSGELEGRAYQHPDTYLIKDVKSWGGRKEFNSNVRRELIGRYVKGQK